MTLEGIAKLHSGANLRSLCRFEFLANRLRPKGYVNLRKTESPLRSSNLNCEASFATPSLKTVYFDLGNVLIFFSLPKLFSNLSQCTGLKASEIETFFFKTDLRELYEKGLIGTEEVFQKFLSRAPKAFSLTEFTNAFSDIFTPNQEIWPLVEQLKQAGYRLVLLSNTSECHFKYADTHYPVLQLFDHKVLSYEVGVWKPDLGIFQHALKYAKCAPEECFYIDDISEFIESARKAGLPGEVFTDVPKLKQQLTDRGCHFTDPPGQLPKHQ